MAKVTYNRSIDSFHGAVGRMVFYERNGQTLIRSKGKRTGPRSEAQIVSQEAFRNAAARWKELRDEQKEPWRAFGKEQRITGYNAFLRVNIPRLKRGGTAMMVAPAGEKTMPIQVRDNDGCRRFMDSIHAMVERISREAAGTGGRFVPLVWGDGGVRGDDRDDHGADVRYHSVSRAPVGDRGVSASRRTIPPGTGRNF